MRGYPEALQGSARLSEWWGLYTEKEGPREGPGVAQSPSFLHVVEICCPLGSHIPSQQQPDLVHLEKNRKLGSARNWNPTLLSSELQDGWHGEGIWGGTWDRVWGGALQAHWSGLGLVESFDFFRRMSALALLKKKKKKRQDCK